MALRIAPFFALLLSLCYASHAAEDSGAWLDRWFAAQTNLQTWSAEVIQTRSLKALTQPLVATGRVWLAVPDRFRWELGQPPQTIAIRLPDTFWVIYPKLKRAEKYPLNEQQPAPWRDALALLESGFPRNRSELENRFLVQSVLETNALMRIALQPRAASARRLMPEIQVCLRTNDFSLAANEIKFMDGSILRNDYHNPVLNPDLSPELFTPKVPPDYKIVEPIPR